MVGASSPVGSASAAPAPVGNVGTPSIALPPIPTVDIEENYYDDYYEPVSYPLGYDTIKGAPGWAFAKGLGIYNYENDPWIYVENLGFLNILERELDYDDREQGYAAWLYSPEIGRFWWSARTGNYIYLHATQTWTYLEGDETSPGAWLFNFDSESWQKPKRTQRHMEDFDTQALFTATSVASDGATTLSNFQEVRDGVEFSGDIETTLSQDGMTGTLSMSFTLSIDPEDFNGYFMSVKVVSFDSNLGTFKPADFGANDPGFPESLDMKLRINDDGVTGDYEMVMYLTDGTTQEESGNL